MNHEKGFTLIEVIVVTAIMGFMSFILIRNFGQSRLDLNEAANIVMGDVRAMQAKAIAGSRYNNQPRCGYGVQRVNATSYRLYAGPLPSSTTNCTSYNRNYNNGGPQADTSIETKTLKDSTTVQFQGNFDDIFFEPIEPKVYINNSYSLSASPSRITIRINGANCGTSPGRCRSICAYPSGRVELVTGGTCP